MNVWIKSFLAAIGFFVVVIAFGFLITHYAWFAYGFTVVMVLLCLTIMAKFMIDDKRY